MPTIIQLGFKSLTCIHSSKSHYDHTYIHRNASFFLRQCRFGGDLLWVTAAEAKKKRSGSKRSHGVFVIFALACEREKWSRGEWVSNTPASIAWLALLNYKSRKAYDLDIFLIHEMPPTGFLLQPESQIKKNCS